MQVNEQDRLTPQDKSSGSNRIALVAVIAAIAASGAAYYYFSAEQAKPTQITETITLPEPAPAKPLPVTEAVPEPETAPVVEVEPPVEVIITEPEPAPEPLPTLGDSDNYLHDKAIAVADGMDITPLLINQNMARKFVVFVDNLAQGELARKLSPINGPSDPFTVTDISNKSYLDPDSYHRYDLYADFVAGLNPELVASTYQQVQPLLDEAYAELGYPDTSFNGRLIQAIDEMLAAPIIEDPIELSTISVNYLFVDPQLETLPASQKLMIRMGPENTRKIKTALRQLKQQLAAQ